MLEVYGDRQVVLVRRWQDLWRIPARGLISTKKPLVMSHSRVSACWLAERCWYEEKEASRRGVVFEVQVFSWSSQKSKAIKVAKKYGLNKVITYTPLIIVSDKWLRAKKTKEERDWKIDLSIKWRLSLLLWKTLFLWLRIADWEVAWLLTKYFERGPNGPSKRAITVRQTAQQLMILTCWRSGCRNFSSLTLLKMLGLIFKRVWNSWVRFQRQTVTYGQCQEPWCCCSSGRRSYIARSQSFHYHSLPSRFGKSGQKWQRYTELV